MKTRMTIFGLILLTTCFVGCAALRDIEDMINSETIPLLDQCDYKEWQESEDAVPNVGIRTFLAQYQQGWKERAAEKATLKKERAALEQEYEEWKQSDVSVNDVTIDDFASKYRLDWQETKRMKQAMAYRTKLVNRDAKSIFEIALESYRQSKRCRSPFPSKSNEDWVKQWTLPRCDLSDAVRAEGEGLLMEFGTKYLPNRYSNYEKAKDAAFELQQVFNEEFPAPWNCEDSDGSFRIMAKTLLKFAHLRSEYFLCHDELCHYWLAYKCGALSSEDLSKIDSSTTGVFLLAENMSLMDFDLIKPETMEAKHRDFISKYMPETHSLLEKTHREFEKTDKLLSEVVLQYEKMDGIRFDKILEALVRKRNNLAALNSAFIPKIQSYYLEHRTQQRSSEELAELDHKLALLYFEDDVFSSDFVKKHSCDPIIPTNSLVSVSNGNMKISETLVTPRQWAMVMGYSAKNFNGAANVGLEECVVFIDKLNDLDQLHYRLPSKQEWLRIVKTMTDKLYFAKRHNDTQYEWVKEATEDEKHNQICFVDWYGGPKGGTSSTASIRLINSEK